MSEKMVKVRIKGNLERDGVRYPSGSILEFSEDEVKRLPFSMVEIVEPDPVMTVAKPAPKKAEAMPEPEAAPESDEYGFTEEPKTEEPVTPVKKPRGRK